MNLFAEFDGRRGEGQVTACLRFLIMRSSAYRKAFLRTLDSVSPIGPLTSGAHFSCYCEHPTGDAELGSGRVDMVLELDRSVIGIEVKLAAVFQQDQPQKYEAELRRISEALSQLRRSEVRFFLTVLAPRRREEKIKDALSPNQRFVSWEELFEELEMEKDDFDPVTEFLHRDLRQYVREQIAFLPELERWLPHLQNQWERRGTPLQREFLHRIWHALPSPSPRMGSGDTWVGYYFSPGEEDERRAWIGFLPQVRNPNAAQGAGLFIASSRENIPDSDHYEAADLSEPVWVDQVETPAWEVLLDESWNRIDVWQERLAPFFQ